MSQWVIWKFKTIVICIKETHVCHVCLLCLALQPQDVGGEEENSYTAVGGMSDLRLLVV